MIDGYDKISEDSGPVIDLFGRMISMENDDYSVMLETKIKSESSMIRGSVPFIKVGNRMVVEAELAGGKPWKFIIDTGASGGLVVKQDAVHAETEIVELKAEARSFEGISVSEGKMG